MLASVIAARSTADRKQTRSAIRVSAEIFSIANAGGFCWRGVLNSRSAWKILRKAHERPG
jgi:hypothetical protein